MRAGVYPNAGCLGRPWLLRLSSSQMESKCYSEQPVLCRGLRARLPHCRGLCIGRPVCQERVAGCTVCAARCAAGCARLVAAEAGSVRKDGGTALGPAAGLTRRLPVCGRTQRPLLEGRRHRGTDPPAPLGEAASREAPQQHIADLRRAALARRCVPVRSCSRGELPVTP